MTHLMTRHKAHKFAHKFVVHVHRLCPFVERSTLCQIPFCQQIHHIMVPTDVTFDDFSTARVDDSRSISILNLCRKVTKYVETSIIHTHLWVVWPVTSLYCMLETSGLKGCIPVFYTLLKIRNPLLRCGRINVEDNGFDRFCELSFGVSTLVFRF